jgi:hypothetical protein
VCALVVASLLAAVELPAAPLAPDAGVDAGIDGPADFVGDVLLLSQVLMCRNESVLPGLDAKVVGEFCRVQKPRYQAYREAWAPKAREFLKTVEPKGLPGELVYPFGGGDLMTALTAFPEVTTITTMSLELAGDPRRLASVKDPATLKRSLAAITEASTSTLLSNDSLSRNLSKVQQGDLPGQLSMHLMGLGMFDFAPVSVRYFRIEPDGSLHYYTRGEIRALDGQRASRLKSNWRTPDFSPAFANVEVQFIPAAQPGGRRRIHRHIAVDLSNDGLARQPGVLKHLEAKGRVAAMTKAASYLLWNPTFSVARDYLTSHAAFMLSDSTGPPPQYWKTARCAVETYGSFKRSFLGTWEGFQQELRTQFADAGVLPMRFGYPDGSPERRNHLIVVRCGTLAPKAGSPDGGGMPR